MSYGRGKGATMRGTFAEDVRRKVFSKAAHEAQAVMKKVWSSYSLSSRDQGSEESSLPLKTRAKCAIGRVKPR
jgi:hypothetical protein